MVEVKRPSGAPPANPRRLRRDPRVESQPPPSEERAEAPPVRMRREPSSYNTKSALDSTGLVAQLTEVEGEMQRLREQNERDEAMIGKMLVRVADVEKQLKETEAEADKEAQRADEAEERAIEAEGKRK